MGDTDHMKKFLIVGAGGTGGCIGGFLATNGEDVTLIARSNHLKEIKENGLKIKSGLKGDMTVTNIKVYLSCLPLLLI